MNIFEAKLPIIGMVHLAPLPGAPLTPQSAVASEAIESVEAKALVDAKALADGGVDAIMIENFGDAPFFPGQNPVHVATVMTRLAIRIREVSGKPIGINVLRNDGFAALAVAIAADAEFIRVNILSGARVTDQGLIGSNAHELLRYRREIGATGIGILADVQVKHSTPLGCGGSLTQEVSDLCQRGMASGVVVSGSGTGKAVDIDRLRTVRAASGNCPVFIGSGASTDNLAELASYASGFIVGTAFKPGGDPAAPVDSKRVAELCQTRNALR
jgi:membrane complex biogenesis BtpA family protein